MADSYDRLTVKQLKEEVAKKDGLAIRSTLRKADIIEALRAWDAKHVEQPTDEGNAQPSGKEEEQPGASGADVNDEVDASDTNGAQAEEAPTTMEDDGAQAEIAANNMEPDAAGDTEASDVIDTNGAHLDDAANRTNSDAVDADIAPDAIDTNVTSDAVSIDPVAVKEPDLDTQTESKPELKSHDSISSSSAAPVSAAEIKEDSLKRKRRSATPPLDAKEIEAKKAKIEEKMDDTIVSSGGKGDPEAGQGQVPAQPGPPADENLSDSKRKTVNDSGVRAKHISEVLQKAKAQRTTKAEQATIPAQADTAQQSSTAQRSTQPEQSIGTEGDTNTHEPQNVSVQPARHLATRSLYIANLKRPLQQGALEKELNTLGASKTSSEPTLQHLYLNAIRTHAFAVFDSIAAASRVRASLHGTKFPKEASREPLLVDFAPDDKVEHWIDEEKTPGASSRVWNTRWKVTYTSAGEAIHEQIGPDGSRSSFKDTAARVTATGHSAFLQGQSAGRSSATSAQPGSSSSAFSQLDARFIRTTTKPMLYAKTVAEELAQKRLAKLRELDKKTSKPSGEKGRKPNEESWLYSFDGRTDKLVKIRALRLTPRQKERNGRLLKEHREKHGREGRKVCEEGKAEGEHQQDK